MDLLGELERARSEHAAALAAAMRASEEQREKIGTLAKSQLEHALNEKLVCATSNNFFLAVCKSVLVPVLGIGCLLLYSNIAVCLTE